MHHHNGSVILFGDMNVVRNEQERPGSIFSRLEADQFNSFIDSTGLVDLHIGGRFYTWMNKAGTKLCKLDRFLISDYVLVALPDIRITAFDQLWSDHNPILLHVTKTDFGPTPFKLDISWLSRHSVDELIKLKWNKLEGNINGRTLKYHEKFCALKTKIKQWNINIKAMDQNRKQEALFDIEKKIDDGTATSNDRDTHTNLFQEVEKIDNFDSLTSIKTLVSSGTLKETRTLNFFMV
ncbi:RNA-directed DNA polymerase, eukaryota, reverse transcriptase zinc-binding domain protein [Tanacetum coccineum]